MEIRDNVWFNKSNKQLFLELKREANGYCYYCQKPLSSFERKKSIYCQKHYKHKILYSFYQPIHLKAIGVETVNYQQHLHRLFFKCNAPLQYRGTKELRVKPNNITIGHYLNKLNIALLKIESIKDIYTQMNKYKRITERILYNITLYYISYYLINKQFKNEEQFNASVTRHIFTYLQKTYIRLTKSGFLTNNNEPIYLINFTARYYNPSEAKQLLKAYDTIFKPLIQELYLN